MTWDAVLTSDILQDYKPSDHMYQSALKLLSTKPEETAMVAAHAYDLVAASKKSVSVYLYASNSVRQPFIAGSELSISFGLLKIWTSIWRITTLT